MHRASVSPGNDLAAWRAAARPFLAARVPPEAIVWGEDTLLFEEPPPCEDWPVTVSRRFLEAAEAAICHADPGRFDLLYRIALRLQEEKHLLDVASDPDCIALAGLVKAVRRDCHKMKAFVRFRALDDSGTRFAAWYEPDHFIVERMAPFFAARFTGMEWAILTPHRCAYWDGALLAFGPGARKEDAPGEDALEDVWRTYFASIFNPARLKVSAMTSEMPRKFWRNLPEAELIAPLIRNATAREAEMIGREASVAPMRHARRAARDVGVVEPDDIGSLAEARQAVQGCTRCPLYQNATQAVFGEGAAHAPLMFVGEQPGDSEDLAGKPFVGPAGKVFDAALEEAGIDRRRTYVTNAVKHFKFTPRGKKRIHQAPNAGEVRACRFWLDKELAFVGPKVVVALGATAAQSLLGPGARIGKLRGAPITAEDGRVIFVTVHPSYLLRMPDRTRAAEERAKFIAELAAIGAHMTNEMGISVALDTPRAGA